MTMTRVQVLVGNSDNAFQSVGIFAIEGNVRDELVGVFQDIITDDWLDGDCAAMRVELAFDTASVDDADVADVVVFVMPIGDDDARSWPVILVGLGAVAETTLYRFIGENS
jgi:hypothetical protein